MLLLNHSRKYFNVKKWIIGSLTLALLAGCSSSEHDEQRQLEMMAQHRAGVLSAGLPIEYGPLSVMRVLAKNTVIEIMMIYNQDAKGAKPLNQVVDMSVNSYCTNSEVRANLDMGLAYNIKIRNTRGQLMVEKLISKDTCQSSS
ncbi:Beta-barrel assembly machine subunit BamC [Vibrio crassostreae]|nr:GspS/AspS pilotin family protein [Vibrio crassostreae]ROO57201.1 Beta-barrel assembly machine subunit BamC [Vibrio crassostreae]ROO74994.1 Beta-barrel assembly machine subunit BamC [Vibrio crassostreae]ROR69719.1 Beta-barrel assembly machine subunit BamC [Vibrio crassostreae]ROR85997.1 Beta-barrel assembly machine subunit BamC [Vibrio crassostreae]RPF58990.1 Beta-barrel assembly machine subunit BamC [Vibrio crassostreae]